MTENREQNDAPASAERDGEAERIAKVLARAGLCSRREAEEWVLAGRVAVNGKVLDSPAFTVTPKDRVTVDGVALPTKERTRLWLFHKPRGLVTTNQDPEGRPTVFSVLPEDMPRVVTVGRLDINTEGLLLLTNDGGVARVLELPSTGWLRRYRVRAFGDVDEAALKELANGVSLDGVDYGPIEAQIERVQGANIWLVLGLREGKNREVKRVLASLGLTDNRLIRVSFGPFQLADLEEGEIREIRGRVLRDQLGSRLVAESGADFDAPIVHHMQGDTDEDEGRKRHIRGFAAAEETPRERERGRGPSRTRMEFVGTGEKRARDRDRERGGERDRPQRSEGFRGRPEGGAGRPQKWRPEGARTRPEGEGGRFEKRRSDGFRDRPAGAGAPERDGVRGRPVGGPEGEGRRGRFGGGPKGAAHEGRSGGGYKGRSGGEGYKGRSGGEGYKGRSGGAAERDGFRDRSRSGEGFTPRKPREGRERFEEGGERPLRQVRPPRDRLPSEGFRGRPEGDRPRSEGFRGRPAGDEAGRFGKPGRPRSEGYRGRPEGGDERPKGRAEGRRDRPEGGAGAKKPPRAEGFGPRGPRGMSPGGRKSGFDGGSKGDGPAKGGRGPSKGGGKGRGGRG